MPVSLFQIFLSFLRVGTFGYGGPLATMAYIRQELVDKHGWVSYQKFLQGLAIVKVLPGPVSCLLSIFLGHELRGIRGGLLAGLGYILPAFLMIVGICFAEQKFSALFALASVQTFLITLGVVVLSAILLTTYKMLKEIFHLEWSGQKQAGLITFLLVASFILARLQIAEWVILIGASAVGFVYFYYRKRSAQRNLNVEPFSIFGLFFLSAFTVFGTGYMLLPVLEKSLVIENQWLSMADFLRAVSYGNLTPGPIVISASYMGYQMASWPGLMAASMGVFLPGFLIVLIGKPLLDRVLDKPWMAIVLMGILPAVVGSILSTWVSLAMHVEWNYFLVVILIGSLFLQIKNISIPKIMGILALGFILWNFGKSLLPTH